MVTKHPKHAAGGHEKVERRSGIVTEQRGPLRLDLALIDEDPAQPRTQKNPGFSQASLEELAATIRLRGVKTPISVRDNPDVPGRFILNHGARRFRATRLAGQVAIPAFVDNDYNDVDQVIENLQRDELTAREIAEFIGRELAKGSKKGEIAQSIGKSAAFVSQHAVLLDLPEPVALAFNTGRVKDVTVVNELVKSHRSMPVHVTRWLSNASQDITRSSVKLLREFLNQKIESEEVSESGEPVQPLRVRAVKFPDSKKLRPVCTLVSTPIIRVAHEGRDAQLMLHRMPSVEGKAWLRYESDFTEIEVALAEVSLVALTAAV